MDRSLPRANRRLLEEAGYHSGQAVVAGVSGGADSMALLHQMRQIVDAPLLHVAHLDHGLRAESGEDKQFVANVAADWDLPFHSDAVDVAQLARLQGQTTEEAAREARYRFLATVARSVGATIVVVGHHAGDQAETVLLHFLRGSGLTGLRGMSLVAPLPGAPELRLVRPLLRQTRAQIETYCYEHGLATREDRSNWDPSFMRNRVRHLLLPELAAYNRKIERHLNQLAAIVEAEDELLAQITDELWPELVTQIGPTWLCLERGRWRELPLALRRRALRRAVYALNDEATNLSFQAVEQALQIATRERSGAETMLGGSVTMLADYEQLIFTTGSSTPPTALPQLPLIAPQSLPIPGAIALANGWVLSAEAASAESSHLELKEDPWQVFVALRPGEKLFVRGRVTGERIQPLGMQGHSASVQDIMVNRKLASRLREQWPLVSTAEHAVWLVGHVLDRRARVTPEAQRLVRLSCRKNEEHDARGFG